ncbi:ATP-binding cassette sub-family D member 4 [Nymphon striatum]|nr:ATP-binding cassette sub-family D member 4 [Nymphon striatum]
MHGLRLTYMDGSATTRQILKCTHYKRTLRAHIHTYMALYELVLEQFFTVKPNLKAICVKPADKVQEACAKLAVKLANLRKTAGNVGRAQILKCNVKVFDELNSPDTEIETSSVNSDHGFNWLLFKRIGLIFKVLYPRIFSPASIPIIVNGNKDGYMVEFVGAFILIILRAVSKSTKRYTRYRLEVSWRDTLCREMHKRYFKCINYYNINFIGKDIDNPDQRMSQDVFHMLSSISAVIADVIMRPFTIGYYTYEVFQMTGIQGVALSYTLIITFICLNVRLLSPIARTTAEFEKREGNYRFQQMHVRVYAESIALQGSEKVEEYLSNKELDSITIAGHAMVWARYMSFIAIALFIYMKDILSFAVFAIPYFSGQYTHLSAADLGQKVGEHTFVVGHLVYMFTDPHR